MDRITKFLQKLTSKERIKTPEALSKILSNDLNGINTKKLKGFEDIFRVRIGSLRIIFRKEEHDIKV